MAGPTPIRWTLPNLITIARICLTPVIALLPFISGYWPKVIAFVVFLVAAFSDLLDDATPDHSRARQGRLRDSVVGQSAAVGGVAARRARSAHDDLSLLRE